VILEFERDEVRGILSRIIILDQCHSSLRPFPFGWFIHSLIASVQIIAYLSARASRNILERRPKRRQRKWPPIHVEMYSKGLRNVFLLVRDHSCLFNSKGVRIIIASSHNRIYIFVHGILSRSEPIIQQIHAPIADAERKYTRYLLSP
jgi:hypothetical protein